MCLKTVCLLAFSMAILPGDMKETFSCDTTIPASWTSFPLNMITFSVVTQGQHKDAYFSSLASLPCFLLGRKGLFVPLIRSLVPQQGRNKFLISLRCVDFFSSSIGPEWNVICVGAGIRHPDWRLLIGRDFQQVGWDFIKTGALFCLSHRLMIKEVAEQKVISYRLGKQSKGKDKRQKIKIFSSDVFFLGLAKPPSKCLPILHSEEIK